MSFVVGAVQTPTPSLPIASPAAAKSQVELFPASAPGETGALNAPVNLARVYLGAKVSVVNGAKGPVIGDLKDPAIGLICDDVSFGYKLPAGKTTLFVSLSQNVATNRFCFLVNGSEGTVQVFAATIEVEPNSSWWQSLSAKAPFVESIQYGVEWAWSDVRYLKVELDLKSPGTLSPIGLFGAPTAKDVKVVSVPNKARTTATNSPLAAGTEAPGVTQQVNVASLTSRGRVAYVSSGLERPQAAATMIDNDLGTAYAFDPEDKNPTFVVELATEHPVCRIATYYQSESPGAWEVYPLAGLPGEDAPATPAAKPVSTADAGFLKAGGFHFALASLIWGQTQPKALRMPPDFFEKNKPTQTISSNPGEPFGSVDFKPERCRFVLLRWVSQGSSSGVKVFQVSVFTDPKEDRLDALPLVNFASIGPDLAGARGLAGPDNRFVIDDPFPHDPPRRPPTPPVVSP